MCLHECLCECVYVLSCLTFLGAHLGLCVGLILVFCKGIGGLQEQANSLCNGEYGIADGVGEASDLISVSKSPLCYRNDAVFVWSESS